MSNSALNELGFAEFVAKLISDTFGAILTSQIEQEEKLRELEEIVALDDEAFLLLNENDPEFLSSVEELLKTNYPSDSEVGHTVFIGSEYSPKTTQKPEAPSYQSDLQIELQSNSDFKAKKLTQNGVDKIYRAVFYTVINKQRDVLATIIRSGVPKLMVDSGKINAKLTFSSQEVTDDNSDGDSNASSTTTTSAGNSGSSAVMTANTNRIFSSVNRVNTATSFTTLNPNAATLSAVSRFAGVINPQKLSSTRLSITPASNRAPQDAQSSADIYSEVEIHFKSIL